MKNLEDKFRLKGQKRSVMGFDQNPYYEGSKYLSDLFNAIVNRQTLHIDYKKFNGDIRNFTIHPYFIKQYIKSKPIHGSMKIVSDDECIVSINVIPNYELEALIGSFSNDVEVMSPQWLREKIAAKYRELAEWYSK